MKNIKMNTWISFERKIADRMVTVSFAIIKNDNHYMIEKKVEIAYDDGDYVGGGSETVSQCESYIMAMRGISHHARMCADDVFWEVEKEVRELKELYKERAIKELEASAEIMNEIEENAAKEEAAQDAVSSKPKAIKNWVLEKQGYSATHIIMIQKEGIEVERETEKACLIKLSDGEKFWCPKSAMIDKWEELSPKQKGYAYHSYLENVANEAYEKGNLMEKRTFTNGRKGKYARTYDEMSFSGRWTTKQLIETLDQYKVEYMSKDEYLAWIYKN